MLRKKGVSCTNKVFYKFGFLLLKDKLAILHIHPKEKVCPPPKSKRISTQGRKVIHPRAKEYPPKFKKIKIAFFSKPQLNTWKNGNELNAKNPIYILLIYIFNSNLDDDDREYNNHHLSSSSFWFFFLQSEF